MHVRHCPSCRCDYRAEIAVCADCGAPLVDRDDEQEVENAPQATTAEGLSEIPAGFEPLFSAGHVRDLTPLADRLLDEGIGFRLREARRGGQVIGYRLLVHGDDDARARAVVGDLADGVAVGARITDGEERSRDMGYERCPACDTRLSPAASGCPECGLPLAEPDPTCPRCGQPLTADSRGHCAGCGLAPADDE